MQRRFTTAIIYIIVLVSLPQVSRADTVVNLGSGHTIVLALRGGRLIGTNAGEFGGAIEWEATGTSARTMILRCNPVAFVTAPSGVFAVEGLAHLSISRGRLLKLVRSGGTWKVKDVVDLGAAPKSVALVGSETLRIVTTDGVTEVNLKKMMATRSSTNK
jgi:hypothetical protein